MDIALDNPPSTQLHITVPEGKLAAPDNNDHPIITHEFDINGHTRRIEMVHQVREGDCVLANFLNTESLEHAIRNNSDSELLMSVQDARRAAVNFRRRNGQDSNDIEERDQPLEPKDVVNLFTSIYGVPEQQEDVLTVEGRGKTQTELKDNALTVLEYLDSYDSGLVSCGLGRHSFSIRKLDGDNYAIIDPMNRHGLQFTDTEHLMEYLTRYISGRPANDNFFFFIRK